MSETKVKLDEASPEQMREFGQTHLGMNLPGNMKPENMRAKIAAAWVKDEIPVSDTPAPKPQEGAPPPPVRADQQPPKPDKVRIYIDVTEDPGGDEAVPVGVNGSVMLIPRGKEVDVPYPYYEALENAVTHRYESYEEGGMNPVPRKVKAYPFRRVA